MQVYITKSNLLKILRKLDIPKEKMEGFYYKDVVENYFRKQGVVFNEQVLLFRENVLNKMFNRFERNILFSYKEMMENFEEFINEVYVPREKREDTYWWIYEEDNPPVYHYDKNCPTLHSDFKNYKIPSSIRYRKISLENRSITTLNDDMLTNEERKIVKKTVEEYRTWWKQEGEYLFEDDPDALLALVNMKYTPNPPVRRIEEFIMKNSGVEKMENASVEEIIIKINKLIDDYKNNFEQDDKHQRILRRYQAWRSNSPKFDSTIGYTDDEIREILKDNENRFKNPLKYYLKELYRRVNNPTLGFDEELLIQLGFRPCNNCRYYTGNEDMIQAELTKNHEKLNRTECNLYFDSDMEADMDEEEKAIRLEIEQEAWEQNFQREEWNRMMQEELDELLND
ncbi:MAG: hypothetical protein KIH02_09715 [Parabacteroides sp.]|nr:hypothetical protein [Parabacteroides sp.]